MKFRHTIVYSLSTALLCTLATSSFAQMREKHQQRGPAARPAAMVPRAEPHPGPQGYHRVAEPNGWNNRPAAVDRGAYQHNFQAQRGFRVGPYHPPTGWRPQRWEYGQMLPRAYWAPRYVLADYWLFALEVPPVGYEWVRVGQDALLINTVNGAILQVQYGVFL